MGFEQGKEQNRTQTSALTVTPRVEMRPHGSMKPAGRMTNPLPWFANKLNIPMFPSLLPSPFNFINFLGNQGASRAAVPQVMLMPSNVMHIQSAPAQIHQQPAPVAGSELNRTVRTQGYPIS